MIRSLATVAAIAVLSLGATGCETIATTVAHISGQAAGPIKGQAKTLAEALQLATVATDLTKAVVDGGKLSRQQLEQINSYNDGLHSALVSLETANARGESLSFAAFNAALAAWNSYTATLPKP